MHVDDSFKSSSTSSVITQFRPTHYRSVPRCGSFFHLFTTLSSSKLRAASSALVPSLTSRIPGTSVEIFIRMSTCSGSAQIAKYVSWWRMISSLQQCQLASTEFYLPARKSMGTTPVSLAGCTASLN